MKKLCPVLLVILLLTLCACAKPAPSEEQPEPPAQAESPAQESPVQAEPAPEEAAAEITVPESFVSTETVPSLLELQGSEAPAEGLLFLKSQQYGPITASYYAAAPNLDVWDVRQALFGTTGEEETALMEVPDDLNFEPFRTYSNPSATYLLICKNDGDVYTYYLYDGVNLHELTTLNARPFGVAYPPHVRWRGDDELVYDIENPETGKYTTYLYQIQTEEEAILLADYDPFPFYAADTVSERVLLVDDTCALRVERGGAIFLRKLPDGDEVEVPDLQTPETAYFHITPLDQRTVLYFAADENDHFTTLTFIDCESGSCAKLERSVSDDMDEQFIMLLDENTVAIPANAGIADGGQKYLFVYSFNKSVFSSSALDAK